MNSPSSMSVSRAVQNVIHRTSYTHSTHQNKRKNNGRELATVMEANTLIRKNIYKKSAKSSNKVNTLKSGDDGRANRAAFLIQQSLLSNNDPVETALTLGAFNCGSLALIAQEVLTQMGFNSLVYEEFHSANHAVAIAAKEPLNVHTLPLDMAHWPKGIFICDPWSNIACEAKDYPSTFNATMQAWEDKGKYIYFTGGDESEANETWVNPTHPDWLAGITRARINWDEYE